jgi:antitoxin (DNA-binding transcriptional repressor) of toxin-antitoxin stability system
MSTMTIEEAQAKLSEVIDKPAPGEEVIITRNEQPVQARKKSRQMGV